MPTDWTLKGTVLIACNCDFGCPCNFNALPSKGNCEGGWTWHVEEGRFGDTTLDGLNFSIFVNWPGAIHQGNVFGGGAAVPDQPGSASARIVRSFQRTSSPASEPLTWPMIRARSKSLVANSCW